MTKEEWIANFNNRKLIKMIMIMKNNKNINKMMTMR